MTFDVPKAAYIHVPFCAHRCGYCNFTLVANRNDLTESYLEAIELELCARSRPAPVRTLYFGGGTPTQLSPSQLLRLVETVCRWHPLEADYESTIEANPADVNPALMRSIAQSGATRLSLGAQSFHGHKLRQLERDHHPAQIARAVELARRAGLDVALDLIFACPGETLRQWEADLEAAISLEPDHLSTYGLTFERGTLFWGRLRRGELAPVEEDLEREMYETAIERLTAAGFRHYEISNFARPGHYAQHNLAYWTGAPYFAYGPGAARYVDGLRETNHRSTSTYLRRVLRGQSPVAERERLSPAARAREMFVFGLRQLAGVDRHDFAERSGFEVDELVAQPLEKFVGLGLLEDTRQSVRLTPRGLMVCDAMWPEFI